MARSICILAAIFSVISVVAICIAPLVDLPATSLRSDYRAILLQCWLMAAALMLISNVFKTANSPGRILIPASSHLARPLDFNSVLQPFGLSFK
jgi:ABC-type branched-subunit amino acid transport system permease subunit